MEFPTSSLLLASVLHHRWNSSRVSNFPPPSRNSLINRANRRRNERFYPCRGHLRRILPMIISLCVWILNGFPVNNNINFNANCACWPGPMGRFRPEGNIPRTVHAVLGEKESRARSTTLTKQKCMLIESLSVHQRRDSLGINRFVWADAAGWPMNICIYSRREGVISGCAQKVGRRSWMFKSNIFILKAAGNW